MLYKCYIRTVPERQASEKFLCNPFFHPSFSMPKWIQDVKTQLQDSAVMNKTNLCIKKSNYKPFKKKKKSSQLPNFSGILYC